MNLDNFQWLYIDKPQWVKVWLEETSEMKLARLRSYKNDWQNANKDQGFVEMTHEKKKMTRKEAVECFEKHIPWGKDADKIIDFYIEAGMLEIVEEVEPKDNTRWALCSIMTEIEVRQGPDYGKLYVAYPSEYGASCLIEGLRMKGYKIVKDTD